MSNHAEAQAAESPSDFVHKLRIGLKELREARVWLQLSKQARLIRPPEKLDPLLGETDELIAIFVVSIRTAEKSRKGGRRR
jgi:four helix bundle protein